MSVVSGSYSAICFAEQRKLFRKSGLLMAQVMAHSLVHVSRAASAVSVKLRNTYVHIGLPTA